MAPLDILFMDIAGIRPVEPGFARCRIRPQLGDLKELRLTAHTVRGPIEFAAVADGGGHRVNIRLPEGLPAELVTPAASRVPLKAETGGVAGAARLFRLAPGATVEFTLLR